MYIVSNLHGHTEELFDIVDHFQIHGNTTVFFVDYNID